MIAYDWGSQKNIILCFNRLRSVEVFTTLLVSYTFETTP